MLRIIRKCKQSALRSGRYCRLAFNTFNCISKYLILLSYLIISYQILVYFYTISYFAFNNKVCREAQGIVDWLEKRSGPQWTEVNSKVGKVFEEIIHSLGEKVEEMNWSMVDK